MQILRVLLLFLLAASPQTHNPPTDSKSHGLLFRLSLALSAHTRSPTGAIATTARLELHRWGRRERERYSPTLTPLPRHCHRIPPSFSPDLSCELEHQAGSVPSFDINGPADDDMAKKALFSSSFPLLLLLLLLLRLHFLRTSGWGFACSRGSGESGRSG